MGRHVCRLFLVLLALQVAGVAPASAAAPVAGGSYVSLPGSGPEWHVELANDGGEFARYSRVETVVSCRDGVFNQPIFLGDESSTYRAVPVRRDGSFTRTVAGYGRVDGHFTSGGRGVVGVIRFFKTRSCRAKRALFRGRLAGRPNAPTPGRPSACDSVEFRNRPHDHDEVTELGLGCTLARRIARRAHFAKACWGIAPGETCLARGVLCGGLLRGGTFDPLASTRCVSPSGRRGTLEVRQVRFCGVTAETWWWRVNLSCATAKAFPIDELLAVYLSDEGDGPCSQDPRTFAETCPSIAGFTCAVDMTPSGVNFIVEGTCTDDSEPYRAIEFQWSSRGRRARARDRGAG